MTALADGLLTTAFSYNLRLISQRKNQQHGHDSSTTVCIVKANTLLLPLLSVFV